METITIRQRIIKGVKSLLIYAAMIAVVANVVSYLRSPESPEKGYDIRGVTIAGDVVGIEDYRGQPLILYVWATWCPTCRFQSPAIEELSKSHQVLSVAVNSGNPESIRSYMGENGYTFNVINDPDGRIQRQLKVSAFPTVFILDENGSRVMSEVGYTSGIGLRLRMAFSRN